MDVKVKAKKAVLEEIMSMIDGQENEGLKSKSPKHKKPEAEAAPKPEEKTEEKPKEDDEDESRLKELYESLS